MQRNDAVEQRESAAAVRQKRLRRMLPLALLALGLAAFFALGLDRYFSLETLTRHQEALAAWVGRWGVLAGAAFALVYAAVVALSVPGATAMTIAGGFLFGPLPATLYAVIGATTGATALFLAARHALAEPLRARAGPWLGRIQQGFNRHGASYMLALRLVPLVPFWLVNLVPALLGVRLRVYVLATLVGIIPGTFVYASVGDGIGAVLARGGDMDLGLAADPRVLVPLVGLALLALLPVAWRLWSRARDRRARGAP